MPQPLTGWISESGAIESATSVKSAPPTSATSPSRHSGLVAYESSTWVELGSGSAPSPAAAAPAWLGLGSGSVVRVGVTFRSIESCGRSVVACF